MDSVATFPLSKTKHRIVQAAIAAFNESSFTQVTTAALAARLGMSEGNLWYHYRTKSDLLMAIQTQFLKSWDALAAAPKNSTDPVADYVAYMHGWQALFDTYLFMFRDRSEYGAHSPELAENLPAIYSEVGKRLRDLYQAMIAVDLLKLPKDALYDLITNVIIITRFSLEFAQEAQVSNASSQTGLIQHLSLLKPHVKPQTYQRLYDGLLGA